MVGRGEGTVRAGHTRLISNAEEIAFYGGSEMEKTILDKGFRELKGLLEGIYSLKIRYNMLEDFVLKYSWCMFPPTVHFPNLLQSDVSSQRHSVISSPLFPSSFQHGAASVVSSNSHPPTPPQPSPPPLTPPSQAPPANNPVRNPLSPTNASCSPSQTPAAA